MLNATIAALYIGKMSFPSGELLATISKVVVKKEIWFCIHSDSRHVYSTTFSSLRIIVVKHFEIIFAVIMLRLHSPP